MIIYSTLFLIFTLPLITGNLYISDNGGHRIRKVTVANIISTIAGTGTTTFSGDNGQATSATLYHPIGTAIDSSGNVYIGDQWHHRIRKVIVSTSIMTTIAGSGTEGYGGDGGQATSASLKYPCGVNLDSSGNVYFGDYLAFNVVRKVTVTSGIISTVAGIGSTSGGYNGDNIQATSATLTYPFDVVLDSYDNLYICDLNNYRVRKVDVSTGIIITVVGTGTASSTGDGSAATLATIYNPIFSRFDSAGNLYISEAYGERVRKVTTITTDVPTVAPSITPTYYPSLSPHSITIITTIAGTGTAGYSGDGGQATGATINGPTGIIFDSSGDVYFAEYYNNRVRKISVATGIITTVVGTGSASFSGDGGPSTSASICLPEGLAFVAGYYYIGDHCNHRIRKVTISTNIISTIAGTGASSYNGDNQQATSAALHFPVGVAVDVIGNIYFGDLYNHRTRKITVSTGIIDTVAGTGTGGYSGDGGPATSAAIMNPAGVNLDSAGNVYFGDCNTGRYNVIRKVTVTSGIISTVAGTGSTSGGYNGDNIQATAATLNFPFDVVFDSYDNLYICDLNNYRVRKVDVSTGIITTVVGTGTASSTGDGSAATLATIYNPIFSRFDSAGNLYLSEFSGAKIRKVITVTTDIPTAAPSITPTYYPSEIPTLFPSSQPTSSPSSEPTMLNIITVNALDIPLTDKVVAEKTNYYLGSYLAYFLSIYIFLYMFSFTRIGKATVYSLYHSSYNSQFYLTFCSKKDVNATSMQIVSDIAKKMKRVMDAIQLEKELQMIGLSSRSVKSDVRETNDSISTTSSKKLLDSMLLSSDENEYSKGYRKYMSQKFTLLSCKPTLYPNGYKVPYCNRMLPPGVYENILLYIAHNHPLFSCWYFMPGSKLGAHGQRVLYIGQNIVVFVLYQFSSMLLQYLRIDYFILQLLVNLFIITPSALSIGLVLRNLYSCPFTETPQFQRKYARYKSTILLLGRLALLPLLLVMGLALILACVFSQGRAIHLTLINYFIFVQLYGTIATLVKYALLFVDNYYYNLSFGWNVIQVLCIGTVYKERIISEQLQADQDYAYRIDKYLFGLIEIEKILNREDAIRAKWIVVVEEEEKAIEMSTSYAVEENNILPNTVENPLLEAPSAVIDTQIELPSHQDVEPSISIDVVEPTDDVAYDTIYNKAESVVLPNLTNNHIVENPLIKMQQCAANGVQEDDESLYIEYQNQCVNTDSMEYSLDGETLTFEEWKIKRKQFKQGTRKSFVAAFQVWEDREATANGASVSNTLHLHKSISTKVNPLTSTRKL